MPVPTDTQGAAPRPHMSPVPQRGEAAHTTHTHAHIRSVTPRSPPLSSRSSPLARDSPRLLVLSLRRPSFAGCCPVMVPPGGSPSRRVVYQVNPVIVARVVGWSTGGTLAPAALGNGVPSRAPDTRRRFPSPRLQNLHWRPASSSHAGLDVADSAPSWDHRVTSRLELSAHDLPRQRERVSHASRPAPGIAVHRHS